MNRGSLTPDEIDLQLVHALQVNPRVPWSRLAPILGLDPTAVARRWAALNASGAVWSSTFPTFEHRDGRLRMMALVEVQVAPGRREDVIRELVERPEIISIHCTSGDRDLYLTLVGADISGIDRFVDLSVSAADGVLRTKTTYVRRTLHAGPRWRLRALQAHQVRALEEMLPVTSRAATFNAGYLEVMEALGGDVRRSLTSLHEITGRSVASVSRAIDAILSNNWATLRVDFAEQLFGWVASAVMWLRVPSAELERVGAAFRLIPQARFCASVAGPANLVTTFVLRDLGELEDIEMRLAKVFPSTEIQDRWIVPRVAKRSGHILTPDGRHERFVSADLASWMQTS